MKKIGTRMLCRRLFDQMIRGAIPLRTLGATNSLLEMLKRLSAFTILFGSCVACGTPEAQPQDMREVAAACGIAAFEVAPTRDATQSPYALHYVVDGGDDRAKLDCYKNRLEARGLRPTLIMGSTRDLENDDALLFARVSESCALPASARITQREGQPLNTIIVYGAAGLSQAVRECAILQLQRPQRFGDIQFSSDPIPARPTVRF